MSSPEAPNLAMNTLSSLLIHGALVTDDGRPVPLALKRKNIPLDLIEIRNLQCCKSVPCKCGPNYVLPNGPPARALVDLPSLPPTTEVELEFTLDTFIDSGKSGVVYSTKFASLSSPAYSVMPFVVKIAARKRNKNLFREAWFYDELQSLQGSTIPRCYGYFEAKLPEGCTFLPWKTVEDMYYERNAEELETGHFERFGNFDSAHCSTLTRFEDTFCITLLMLERLGGPYIRVGEGEGYTKKVMWVHTHLLSCFATIDIV
ncbi:hypothetical protein Hypma_012256 [Hypsizygus marmoreus]|uniref:Uncharacterized protein n=1 Tax=Hypsizygus marmoreus TaxID=39966 RepID=A0A369JER7_HYPMA|nr:hypothetical protein Hypma_012256 [Hypsizygus marmoreus]